MCMAVAAGPGRRTRSESARRRPAADCAQRDAHDNIATSCRRRAPGPRARRAPFPDPLPEQVNRAADPSPAGNAVAGRPGAALARDRGRVGQVVDAADARRRAGGRGFAMPHFPPFAPAAACTCRPRSRPRWSIRAPWSRSTTASSRGCAAVGGRQRGRRSGARGHGDASRGGRAAGRAIGASPRREWRELPYFALLKQSYLLAAEYLTELAALAPLPEHDRHRLEFMTRQFVDAMAPTNFPATNPEVLERALATEGASLVQGVDQPRRRRAQGPHLDERRGGLRGRPQPRDHARQRRVPQRARSS